MAVAEPLQRACAADAVTSRLLKKSFGEVVGS
jgi:hypothetical protein